MRAIHQAPQATLPLKVIVVGAGIAGTAAAVALCRHGHSVILLERAPEVCQEEFCSRKELSMKWILEIGAGIQVAPNMLLLLDRWGLGDQLRAYGVALKETNILRWQNGQVLGMVPVNNKFEEQFVVHRADLYNVLLEKELTTPNFQPRLNSTVVDVNLSTGTAILSSGEKVEGDVVPGADGIKSLVGKLVLTDGSDVAVPTGDAVFRVMLHRNQLVNDEELRPFIEEAKAIGWIGPAGHVVAYPVRNHQLYNIVLAHPDRGGVDESWTKIGSKASLLNEYRGWDARLVKMLSLVPDQEILEWKLCSHPPLHSWVSGRPYIAQGAAQAVEDVAALGTIFGKISSKDDIPWALKIYERARKSRAEMVQRLGGENRYILHLPDGPEQVARDQKFKSIADSGSNPDRWGNMKVQQLLWHCDSEQSANETWEGNVHLPLELGP